MQGRPMTMNLATMLAEKNRIEAGTEGPGYVFLDGLLEVPNAFRVEKRAAL